jgi:hypothetical protein
MNNPQHISLIISEMNIFSREKVSLKSQQNVGEIQQTKGSGDAFSGKRNIGALRQSKRPTRISKRKIGKAE